MKTEYHITPENKIFTISCENCAAFVFSRDEAKVPDHAHVAGFIAVHTPEDGTINFCPNCIPKED